MRFGDSKFGKERAPGPELGPEARIRDHLTCANDAISNLEFIKAEKLIECAIEEADRYFPGNSLIRSSTRKAQADLAILQNDLQRADELLGAAIQILAASPETPLRKEQLGVFLMHKGDLYNLMGRPKEAYSLWARAVDLAEGDPVTICSAYMGMARSSHRADDKQLYASHMSVATSQIQLARNVPQQVAVLMALRHGGIKEAESGRFYEAALLLSLVLQYLPSFESVDPSDITSTTELTATFFERAGNFDKSLQLRRQLVKKESETKGDLSPEALFQQCGMAHLFLEYGHFESAENLLVDSLTKAKLHGDVSLIVEAGLTLVSAYREQGLYREAATVTESLAGELMGSLTHADRIRILQMQATCRADHGSIDKALHLIDHALEQVTYLEGAQGLIAQATLYAIRTSILTGHDRDKAEESFAALEETLLHLPPGQEPLSASDTSILSARIRDEDTGTSGVVRAIKQEIETCTQEFGRAKSIRRAELLRLLAEYQRGEDPASALETLEQARVLLEERNRTTTVTYGVVLRDLAALLDPEDPRLPAYEAAARRLLDKIPSRWIDDSDPETPHDL